MQQFHLKLKAWLVTAWCLAILSNINGVRAHTKWVCPTPRSQSSSLKTGPCGGIGSPGDTSAHTTVAPGPFTVYFQETIFHYGAPWRIALSQPGVDNYETCILLDHLPHNDAGSFNQILGATVNIPNFNCPNCALQVIQFMTDKVSGSCTFNPNDTANFANSQCGSNYFSCANLNITGTQPFDASQCVQPSGFAQSYLYHSGEQASWKGMYLAKGHGDPSVGTPVVGQCTESVDPDLKNYNPDGSASSDLSSGATAGIVVGCLVGVFGLAAFVVVKRRKMKHNQRAREESAHHSSNNILAPLAEVDHDEAPKPAASSTDARERSLSPPTTTRMGQSNRAGSSNDPPV